MIYYIFALTLGMLLGLLSGFLVGFRIASRTMIWALRAHYYAQGMNHHAVEKSVQNSLTKPGMPSWSTLTRIRDQRKAEGLPK